MAVRLERLRSLRAYMEIASVVCIIALFGVYAETAALLPRPEAGAKTGLEFLSVNGFDYALTLLFLISCVVLGGIGILSRFPKLYVYPVEIRAKNIEIQFLMAKLMLSVMQIIGSAFFIALMVTAYRRAINMSYVPYSRLWAYALTAWVAAYLIYFFGAKTDGRFFAKEKWGE